MNYLRQLGSGLLYALVSVVLVVGGLSLALAEGGIKLPPAAGPSSTSIVGTSAGVTATPAAATPAPSSATPQGIVITATGIAPSATLPASIVTATSVPPLPTTYSYASPRPTSTRIVYATRVPCGPYPGWLLSYTVKSGDTLYHIATLYRTTVQALQIANCKSTTVIYPGERLWVPNVPTITPGVTFIPTFPTDTAAPTLPLTLTPPPSDTETAVPTNTSNPNP